MRVEDGPVEIVPVVMAPLLVELSPAFTRPTSRRAAGLIAAGLLTGGRHTVANLLRRVEPLVAGEASGYRRVLSAARWSETRALQALAGLIVGMIPQDQPVILVGDDTVAAHPGRKVYGKARHRDPVRSTRGHTVWRWGHRWIVLAVLVRLPFAVRPWALPIAIALYRSEADNRRESRRHRTPAQLMRGLLALTLQRFPTRRFLFVGDSGFGTHELATWVSRRRRLELVSKAHPKMRLFEPAPAYRGLGRPRVKGARLPTPRQAVAAAARRRRLTVDWYGGGKRRVSVVTGVGQWYQIGQGQAAVRWVHVRDLSGTHRDEYFYTTDQTLTPEEIISLYTGRWNLETTFQEAREHLGFETTRGRCRQTVLRAEPCLLCLYSIVAWLYARLPIEQRRIALHWRGKRHVTFSDALIALRRRLWTEWIFPQTGLARPLEKIAPDARELLLSALTIAA